MGEGDQGDLIVAPTDLAPATGTDAEIDRLRSEIEATRERIRDSLGELQEELVDSVDWRGWVADHPWQTVGMAFALGFLVGSG